MKGSSLIYHDNVTEDLINFKEGDEAKAHAPGRLVRVEVVRNMKIDGEVKSVTCTAMAQIVAVDGSTLTVLHDGKKKKIEESEVRELNRKSRVEYSVWTKFEPRGYKRGKSVKKDLTA